MPTPCPRSHVCVDYFRTCTFFVTFSLVIYFFQSKLISVCQRSRWLRWHDVRIVVDYADLCPPSRWLRRHEYLRKNEQFRETVYTCSYGAQVEFFDKKKCRKSRDSVPLIVRYLESLRLLSFFGRPSKSSTLSAPAPQQTDCFICSSLISNCRMWSAVLLIGLARTHTIHDRLEPFII